MADEQLFIVSTLTDADGIFVYHITDADGHLELGRQYKEISNPFFIHLHPNGKVLYSIDGKFTDAQVKEIVKVVRDNLD